MKPVQIAGISKGNAQAERLSEQWTVGLKAKLQRQLWNFEDNLSADGIIMIQYTSKPERCLFILLITAPINF